MDLKKLPQSLFVKIFNVIIVFVLIYAISSFVYVTLSTSNYIVWFSTDYFKISAILIISVSYIRRIVATGKIPKPKENAKRYKINIPDYYNVKNKSLGVLSNQWICPKCGYKNIGTKKCRRCGYEKKNKT